MNEEAVLRQIATILWNASVHKERAEKTVRKIEATLKAATGISVSTTRENEHAPSV